jgi:hypothetical protein
MQEILYEQNETDLGTSGRNRNIET